jgi:hypothetical protein
VCPAERGLSGGDRHVEEVGRVGYVAPSRVRGRKLRGGRPCRASSVASTMMGPFRMDDARSTRWPCRRSVPRSAAPRSPRPPPSAGNEPR